MIGGLGVSVRAVVELFSAACYGPPSIAGFIRIATQPCFPGKIERTLNASVVNGRSALPCAGGIFPRGAATAWVAQTQSGGIVAVNVYSKLGLQWWNPHPSPALQAAGAILHCLSRSRCD